VRWLASCALRVRKFSLLTRLARFRCAGEAKSAQLLGEAIQNNPSFLTLRKIEAAREIAATVAGSSNRVLLSADSLLLNLKDLEVDMTGKKK
jgi:prohibitin 2